MVRMPIVPGNYFDDDQFATGGASDAPTEASDTGIESVTVSANRLPDDPDVIKKFAPVIGVTGIAPYDVAQQARTMPFGGPQHLGFPPDTLFDHVRTQGKWDVKNLPQVTDAIKAGKLSSGLAEEYGNFLYGVAMESNRKSLPVALTGAGGYQASGQRYADPSLHTEAKGILGAVSGAILSGLEKMGSVMPHTDYSDTMSKMTDRGFQWGDNPGDSKKIQNGWLYAKGRHY